MTQGIKFRLLKPDAIVPLPMSKGAVGLDVFAYAISETNRRNTILIPPRSTRQIPTGLQVEPPEDHFLMVCSRSGLAVKHSIFVANAPGIIDPDYRGELMVLLYNGGHESYYVQHHDRIAQILVVPAVFGVSLSVQELSPTERGEKGLGSTGQ